MPFQIFAAEILDPWFMNEEAPPSPSPRGIPRTAVCFEEHKLLIRRRFGEFAGSALTDVELRAFRTE